MPLAVATSVRRPAGRLWSDAIRAAVLTARDRRVRVLLSLPFEIEVPSPWRLAAAMRGERALAWWGAGDRQAFLGLGSALRLEACEPADVPRVLQRAEDALALGLDVSLATGLDPALVRAYGAVAFDPAWPGPGVPAARFDVPAVTLRQAPGAAPGADGAVHLLAAPWDLPGEVADRAAGLLARVEQAAEVIRARPRPAPDWRVAHPRQGKDRFCASVARAVQEIRRGTIEKVVVSRDADLAAGAPGDEPWQAFARMVGAAPDTCRFASFENARDGFFGASPERLVEIQGRQVRADCLAGTSRSGAGGAKERREFDLVVAGVRSALEPLCDGLAAPREPVWRPVPGLRHLWAPVSGQLREGIGVPEVVAALHPTPAVGGSPRDLARSLIRFLEGRPREWYASAVGWIAPGEADFAVGIRAVRILGGAARLTVGAGIVAGSEAEEEWEETGRKAEAILATVSGAAP